MKAKNGSSPSSPKLWAIVTDMEKIFDVKAIIIDKANNDKKTYKKVSGNKKILINKTTGKVTLKKGLKKGTYKVKVKVQAAGNASYKASAWKTVTFRVKVK